MCCQVMGFLNYSFGCLWGELRIEVSCLMSSWCLMVALACAVVVGPVAFDGSALRLTVSSANSQNKILVLDFR